MLFHPGIENADFDMTPLFIQIDKNGTSYHKTTQKQAQTQIVNKRQLLSTGSYTRDKNMVFTITTVWEKNSARLKKLLKLSKNCI